MLPHLFFGAAAILLCASAIARPARAEFIITFAQSGADVVANGSGSFNLTDLTLGPYAGEWNTAGGFLIPPLGDIGITPITGQSDEDEWLIPGGGPASFGTGSAAAATAETGTGFAFYYGSDIDSLYLPSTYVSGTTFTDNETVANTTLAALGLTSGTYTWSWGSGDNADSLQIDIPAVPEPGGLGLAATGLIALSFVRKRSMRTS